MASMGLKPEDFADDPDFEVWPENWGVFRLFAALGPGQWQYGAMGGVQGLRYEAVYPLLDRAASSPEEWDDLFADVRSMEQAVLPILNEKKT